MALLLLHQKPTSYPSANSLPPNLLKKTRRNKHHLSFRFLPLFIKTSESKVSIRKWRGDNTEQSILRCRQGRRRERGKKISPMGSSIARKLVFCMFPFISAAVMLSSWVFVVRSFSAGRPSFLDRAFLPAVTTLSAVETESTTAMPRPSRARAILVDREIAGRIEKNIVKVPKCSDGRKTRRQKQLKVFMYDMPPEFHFSLLEWKPEENGNVWPDVTAHIPGYPGGLNFNLEVEDMAKNCCWT